MSVRWVGVCVAMGAALSFAGPACYSPYEPYPTSTEGGRAYHEEVVTFSGNGSCADALNACASNCETAPENQICGDLVCAPNHALISQCKESCFDTVGCAAPLVGPAAAPCRQLGTWDECGSLYCAEAAADCTTWCLSFPIHDELNRRCHDECCRVFGCCAPAADTCVPLPAGHVYCGCPLEHGVRCHPEGQLCP